LVVSTAALDLVGPDSPQATKISVAVAGKSDRIEVALFKQKTELEQIFPPLTRD
jgi:hypothetical protein